MGETFLAAFQGIWAHKLRAFLTMLGVIIGIAAIISIVSTIKGTNEQIMQNLIGAGNNNVTVSLKQGDWEYTMDAGTPDGVRTVSAEQIREIRDLESVEDASFYLKRNADSITKGKNNLEGATILGIDTHYLQTTGYRIREGRPFIPFDYRHFHKIVLLDDVAAGVLFPAGDAVGTTIDMQGEPFVVVGIVAKENTNGPVIESYQDYLNYEEDSFGVVMIPTAVWPVIFGYDEPENCVAKAVNVDSMSVAGQEVEKIMNRSLWSHDAFREAAWSSNETEAYDDVVDDAEYSEEDEADINPDTTEASESSGKIRYKAVDLLEKARNKQQLAASTNNLLIWVASIALLVGGIGVMNIMLVSVFERTGEIGLKKALGASKKRILAQFLLESALLTSIGGVLGVAAGIAMAQVISRTTGTPSAISIPAIILAVVFSMAIGIVFGLLPSIKAANLNPIDALRHE